MNILIVVLIVLGILIIAALDALEEKRRKEREVGEALFDLWCEENKDHLMRMANMMKASTINASKIKTGKIAPNVARTVLTGRRKEVDKVDEGTEE